ncbi:response regulator [Sphingomonas sp. PAMC 26617]|uniref:response regulator n=1 Tax=Sphingomonas sp. PAMC 26617 TaxID=1112216 RepID=UPI000288DAFA|nr:response regulator [Sphingomonas sp. PAMC 26617]
MSDSLRILYVDDDDDIRTIVEMALSLDPAIEVRAARSGAVALRLVDAGPWRPDAIILDVMMPEMDGIALLAALRERPGLAETPALFMTARGHESDALRPQLEGATGVILKPFDPIELVGTVRRLIGRG